MQSRKLGLKAKGKCEHNLKEPWCERRITQSINGTRKHIKILERKKRNEKRDYQELDGKEKGGNAVPDVEERKRFWSNIWSQEKQHETEAEWLKTLKEESGEYQPEDLRITKDMIRDRCRKIPNWKAPSPDGVHGFWLKNLTALHRKIVRQMDEILSSDIQVPAWMTKGTTVLCQKNPSKGNAFGNFRSKSCLPLVWKLMTGILSNSIYKYLDENDLLPVERKVCRCKSRGTKDQLLIDKTTRADCKKRHNNLAIAWVDYKKAYGMVPHSSIIECLKLLKVSHNILTLIQSSMVKRDSTEF
ncbi:uncharacterized protein LOC106875234 [Octopus bimaculoides]|uniref:uncharacterized protein LOC106875234 n=1 Tax=Octopus bimaculoides TaxID=37653 RepID=UPI00071D6812|nr:uncharacterized protein LOC106875234 [Octopus bimaculoides]|eukprot:XP_014778780.1 PREDICTED: uncharacterized protein LOC106875234 [Octopus bimaculoides]